MKRLLLVVDFQNDFVSGALGFSKAKKIEKVVCKLIKKHREEKNDIIFTFDTHDENYLNTSEGKIIPTLHCIKNTDGWNLFGDVAKLKEENDKSIYKNTFGAIQLMDILGEKKYKKIEICGLVSNICVLVNAIICKTVLPESEIIVFSNATASYDEKMHKSAMIVLKSLQIIIKEFEL